MKTKIKPWMIVVGIVILLALWVGGTYNRLVSLSGSVDGQWANVQSQYQRRMDLIPNLVNTVKGYAKHEEGLFTKITELRSQWQANVNKGDIPAQQGTIASMETAFARLLVVVENYPQLKANQNFLALQDELAGTENRIAVERQRYNDAVKNYNIRIKKVPTNIVANLFDFEQKQFFEAEAGAENTPKVEF